jgi:hypothetical protein
MLGTCPACGFVAPRHVNPNSPHYHRLHKTAHLAKFPKAPQGTIDALDELIHQAERRAAVRLAVVS